MKNEYEIAIKFACVSQLLRVYVRRSYWKNSRIIKMFLFGCKVYIYDICNVLRLETTDVKKDIIETM